MQHPPYPKKSLVRHLLLVGLTTMGTSTAYAQRIDISDGLSGHIIENQTVDGASIWHDGTEVTIKNTTINNRLLIADGAKVQVENNALNCTTSNCIGIDVQGLGHIVGSSGTSSDLIGSSLDINSNGIGISSSASALIDLTDVTINASGNGLDLNGSVAVNNIANITKIDSFDITAGRYGVYAMFGAEVHLSNGSITTTSDNGHGVYLGGANYKGVSPIQTTAYMKNVTVHTKGDNAFGIYSVQMGGSNGQPNRGAVSYWDNSHIITEGKGSYGIVGNYSSNTVELSNGSTVTTLGDNAYGIWSRGGANISLDNSQIVTNGKDSMGVYSYHYGNSYLKNGSVVETSGEGAHGAMVQYAGNISLQDSTIIAKGNDAHGIYMLVGVAENGGNRNGSKVDLQHSSIVSEQGYGIATDGGYLQVNVLDGSLLKGEAGLMNVQDYTGSGTPSWDQGVTTVNLDVDSGSAISGKVQKADSTVANITLKNNSVWEFDADSTLTNLTNDKSTIRFIGNSDGKRSGNHFSTLTVEGDYVGNDGLIIMNTALNGDDSLTDKLIVNGNTSGNTYVQVNNLGGLGNQTIEGIEIIKVKGSSAGNFEQQGRIVAGAYDYSLVKGTDLNANNWYLTSKLTSDSTDNILRPEAGSYLGNLVAANTMFNSRLHDRQGETSYIDFVTGERKTTSMWLRYQYGHSEFGAGNQLDVKSDWNVMMLGSDIAAWSSNDNNRLHLGVMAGYGRSTNDVAPNQKGNSSSGQVDGYSVGIYGTWYENDITKVGTYVDSWLMWNDLNASVDGDGLQSERYDLNGFTTSLESGYTFLVTQAEHYNLWLQPQGQLTWMGVKADRHIERDGSIITGKGNNLQTRLGLRTILDSNSTNANYSGQVFFETNWLYNTEPFSVKMNNNRVYQSGSRNLAEMKGGIEGTLNKDTNIWANLGYQLGNHDYRNLALTLGAQFRF